MMNADLNRQWRRTIRDMSSPQVAEAMACLDPAGSPGSQRPMSASAAARVLLWAIQSIPRREAPDKRLRSLASQRTASITSALARAELPEHVLSSVDADLHCANQALRELLGSPARPIVLGKTDHRDERTAKASSPGGTALSATDQSTATYRIMHDLTIAYGLYAVIALLIWLATIAVVAVLIAKRIPLTPPDLMQGWARTAELLDDPTSLMLPVTTLIIGMLSIPILTGDGRSASLEDRGRQLFLNRVIRIASFTVAVLSLLTMPRPHPTGVETQLTAQGVISGAMIALLALLPPALIRIVVDESHRLLQRAETAIERIDAMLSEDCATPDDPTRPEDRTRYLRRAFLFVGIAAVILCPATVLVYHLTHSALKTAAYPLASSALLLLFLTHSTTEFMRARLLHEIYTNKIPRRTAAGVQTFLFAALTSLITYSPMALTGHTPWFLISSGALMTFQTVFAAKFQHLFPGKARKMRKRFLVHERALNEQTIEAEHGSRRGEDLVHGSHQSHRGGAVGDAGGMA